MTDLNKFYLDNVEIFKDLAKERKLPTRSFHELALENVKRSIFAIIESGGGGPVPNIESDHYKERALYHLVKALEELDHI
jgi:hypothetical protein